MVTHALSPPSIETFTDTLLTKHRRRSPDTSSNIPPKMTLARILPYIAVTHHVNPTTAIEAEWYGAFNTLLNGMFPVDDLPNHTR